jgi:hypothetical protein
VGTGREGTDFRGYIIRFEARLNPTTSAIHGRYRTFNPLFVYRLGRLQTVPDALSRMTGLREEGEPADTPWFFELNEDNTPENKPAPAPSVLEPTPETQIPASENPNDTSSASHDTKKSTHLHQLRKYLRAVNNTEDTPEDIKEDASKYILKEKELWEKERDIQVILDIEKRKEIAEAVHKDLGHYGKDTTVDAVKKRHLISSDLLKEGTETLDACVCTVHTFLV